MYKNDPCFSPKYRVIPAQTLTPFDVNIITLSLKYIFLYICLTSEADRNEFQCHANCSVFQVLICLKSKKEKSVTWYYHWFLMYSFLLHVLAIHLDRPVTPVNRLSETRMFTFKNLKFKPQINNQRMNATELLLYLWLLLSLDTICSVRFRGKSRH